MTTETTYQRQTREVYEILDATYKPPGINLWLHSKNRNLHMRRPADLLAQGQGEVALAEARRVAGL